MILQEERPEQGCGAREALRDECEGRDGSRLGWMRAWSSIVVVWLLISGGCSRATTLDQATGLHLIRIRAGRFVMGSPETEPTRATDETQHAVVLTRDFYLGRDEVTQDEWARIVGSRPSNHAGCGSCPVERVNFLDVQHLLNLLNERSLTFHYRLPTEAEWEYACRAGTTTAYATGTTITTDQANYNGSNPNHLRAQEGQPGGHHSGRDVSPESLGPPRHARERLGVDGGLVRSVPLDRDD